MKIRKCDLCSLVIKDTKGVSFGTYDLCERCSTNARYATCRKCCGTRKVSEVDREATNAQASCGENRTQYRTITCKNCK